MHNALRLAALAAITCLFPALHAQVAAQTTSSACPTTKTLDDFIYALDDAVSGPADKDRTCLRQLLTADARLTPLAKAADGTLAPKPLTVDDWIDRVRKRGHEAFYEVQIKYSSETFGSIAHLWSTYEIRPTPTGASEMRGINSIQAVKLNGEWKVAYILWQVESADEPLPKKYLP